MAARSWCRPTGVSWRTSRASAASRTSAEAKGYADGSPTLTIQGTVIAGGFAVQSELDEGSAKFYEGVSTARQAVEDATKKATDAVTEKVGTTKPDLLEIESDPDPEMTPAT